MESRPTMIFSAVPYAVRPDLLSCAGLFILSASFFILKLFDRSPFPMINGQKTLEFSQGKAKERWLHNARDLINSGLAKVFGDDILRMSGTIHSDRPCI